MFKFFNVNMCGIFRKIFFLIMFIANYSYASDMVNIPEQILPKELELVVQKYKKPRDYNALCNSDQQRLERVIYLQKLINKETKNTTANITKQLTQHLPPLNAQLYAFKQMQERFGLSNEIVTQIAYYVQEDVIIHLNKMLPFWICAKTLKDHTNGVKTVAIEGNTLVSGSEDKTIKIWDLKKNECTASLTGHTVCVRALVIKGNTLVYGSDDKIKIWDLENNEYTATLTGHTGCVRALAIHGNTLFSRDDGIIKIWDLKKNECTATLKDHTNWVRTLVIDGDTLVSGSADKIKIWNLTEKKCIATLRDYTDFIRTLAINIDNNMLVFGADHSIKICKPFNYEKYIYNQPYRMLLMLSLLNIK